MTRRTEPLDKAERASLWNKAKATESMTTLAKVADKSLANTTTPITVDQREALLVRVMGGETIGSACRSLNLVPGSVRRLAYVNEDFGHRLALAYSHGMHALVEELLELPYDDTLTDANKKLLSDNIKWIAARVNRPVYGDSQKHELTIKHEPVVLPIDAIAYDDEDGL